MAKTTNAIIMKPAGQNAIEAASRSHSKLFAVYIVVLVVSGLVLALLTYLTWRSGNAVQDAIVADANARIEEAKSTAAQADERSKGLENSNLTLRGQVATLETNAAEATRNVAVLQKSAADAKAAQQRVEIDLAKQQERAAVAERDLLVLQDKIRPRHLSVAQKDLLVDKLRGVAPVVLTISWPMSSEDGAGYGKDFADVFRRLGWSVTPSNMMTVVSGPFSGVQVGIRGNPPPAQAIAIINALNSLGIATLGIIDPELPENSIAIRIGNKQ